jgi:hypothetical protein
VRERAKEQKKKARNMMMNLLHLLPLLLFSPHSCTPFPHPHSSDLHSFTSLQSVLSDSLLLPNPLSFEGEEKSDQTKEWLFDWLKGRKETARLLVEVAMNIDGLRERVAEGGIVVNVQAEITGKSIYIYIKYI